MYHVSCITYHVNTILKTQARSTVPHTFRLLPFHAKHAQHHTVQECEKTDRVHPRIVHAIDNAKVCLERCAVMLAVVRCRKRKMETPELMSNPRLIVGRTRMCPAMRTLTEPAKNQVKQAKAQDAVVCAAHGSQQHRGPDELYMPDIHIRGMPFNIHHTNSRQ